MTPAFRTFSNRVLPLNYDALAAVPGTQALTGGEVIFGLQPFIQAQIAQHDPDRNSPFNHSQIIVTRRGPQSSPGPHPFFRIWTAWQASAGIRIGFDIQQISDTAGQASSLFPTTQTDFLGLAFDNSGFNAIAIDDGSETILINRFIDDSGTQLACVPFLGITPVLFFLGTLFVEEVNNLAEIVCLYAKAGSSSIFARFQRDNFATEYTILQNGPVSLGGLVSAHGDTGKLVLLARDINGRDITFTSGVYSNLCLEGESGVALALKRIAYTESAVLATAQGDNAGARISLTSIGYFDTIVVKTDAALSADAGGVGISLLEIDYVPNA